ncbi:sulfurtransferase-like selenium metabolism protein YedF [Clostridium sp.]|uniref:sulfurtransferase-like selenium metabolism protein YedF n=1 Tax=Clostridium sp. TaxID=1506 RepID=UPI001B63E9B1|nr:sulfurtransferase-like selenium metabolism protein YedF [Clostridium sp.]MBP3916857.1 sulfurtransferase-like selenium metabolism protein YedF [Clostridium sp.]
MKKFIDAKGKNCPMPVIMAKKEIDAGVKFFEIEVDNKIAVENLKKLANSQGFTTTIEESNGNFRVNFSNGCEECEEVLAKVQGKKPLGNWSIFVNKEIIGAGNEELGQSLMKMFIYTISEGEDLPKSILFMNGGVKVPSLNEQGIEHLKVLQDKGVELLVCGACLNFYGLEDKLEVGKISNMYEITNAMKEASKVITI